MSAERVVIHYRRPPDRQERFEQRVVHRSPTCVVTLLEAATVPKPMVIDGVAALEPGAPIVWFTFAGAWHDIGRFHTRAGEFTGLYANVLTPVAGLHRSVWRTTDLFLDLWQPRTGAPRILDTQELEAAVAAGGVDDETAARARTEADTLLEAALAGSWPPPIVGEWTLERARRHVPR